MHWSLLLAANDLVWIKAIVPLILGLIWVVNQILSRERKGLPVKPARPMPRRPSPPGGNAQRPPAPARPTVPQKPAAPQKTDPLLAEIQKFLKQSNPEKRSPARPQPPAAKPARIEVVKPRGGTAIGDTGARPLDSRHLDTDEFSVRAARMTDDMKRGDAEREQHFQQTFSHKLGRLTDTSVAGDKAIAPDAPAAAVGPSGPPTPLSDWLPLPTTKPEDLRRAVMLNEILQRPTHRW